LPAVCVAGLRFETEPDRGVSMKRKLAAATALVALAGAPSVASAQQWTLPRT
jgi:hypothetical protein